MAEQGAPGQRPPSDAVLPEQGVPKGKGIAPEQGVPIGQGILPGEGRLPGSPGQVFPGTPGQIDKGSPGQMMPDADNPWAPGEDTESQDEADALLAPSGPDRDGWEPPIKPEIDEEDGDEED